MNYASLGSISSYTLKDDDLLEAFAEELHRLASANGTLAEYASLLGDARSILDNPNDEEVQDHAGDVLQDLQDSLGAFAPPYCYFGAHEGDGSDFGFWPSWEAIEDEDHDDIGRGAELPCACCSELAHFLIVNDHGNATLYARQPLMHGKLVGTHYQWTEVWSIV